MSSRTSPRNNSSPRDSPPHPTTGSHMHPIDLGARGIADMALPPTLLQEKNNPFHIDKASPALYTIVVVIIAVVVVVVVVVIIIIVIDVVVVIVVLLVVIVVIVIVIFLVVVVIIVIVIIDVIVALSSSSLSPSSS